MEEKKEKQKKTTIEHKKCEQSHAKNIRVRCNIITER